MRALEDLIAEDPSNAKAHYFVAQACMEALMTKSSIAEWQQWGDRVMQEYDRSLELDPGYWEPRFDKAVYLSHYPEASGKTPDAIREFETLIGMPRGSNADARYAGTYAQLASLYLRVGKTSKAVDVLRQGIAAFPQNEALRKQLDVIERD